MFLPVVVGERLGKERSGIFVFRGRREMYDDVRAVLCMCMYCELADFMGLIRVGDIGRVSRV
jgi:hypothetical protein